MGERERQIKEREREKVIDAEICKVREIGRGGDI